jgi:hypothetical protein
MVIFFGQLKARVLEQHLEKAVLRVLGLISNNPGKVYASLPEILQACGCVTHVLHEGLRQPLGEEGQKKMVKLLTQELSKRTCNEYVLIVALRQLASLFLDLGQGASLLWALVESPISNLLSHTSTSVRVCTCTVLYCTDNESKRDSSYALHLYAPTY